jgi:predicted permease
LRAGRPFTAQDNAQSTPVIVVNETFARQFWPGQNALGKHVVIGRRPQPATVIAVAADIRNRGLEQDSQPQIYLPFAQLPWGEMNLLVRTGVAPLSIAPAVRAQIAAVDADQPITKIQTVDDLMNSSRAQPQFIVALVAAFSITALTLAIIGIYSVLSYTVALRRHEFGIRLALGAERADILRLVLRQGLALSAAGIVIGLAAAFLLTRLVAGMLYKVGAHDLVTFILAPALFMLVALAASYLPAARATRVNPIEALR